MQMENLLCCQYRVLSDLIFFSFQACERVRHLGCLSAQALASRYDKSSFIEVVFVKLSYEAYELFLEDQTTKMVML